MAELEDVTLDGKPLHSLRVADLKLALEHRNLPKSGQKNALIKRLKGALMLENLQRTSTPHIGLQPNSQIGEEMSQNSFIKQYLAKQQELLRQRLEREAREAVEADDESPSEAAEEDHTDGNDEEPYLPDKHRPMPSQPPLTRAEEEGGGLPGGVGPGILSLGMMGRRPDFSSGSVPQEPSDTPGGRIQRPPLHPGHEEPATPSPPRAVASLSVRVLGQPERQGLPPSMPRPQEREGAAPAEPGSAHPVLYQSRSARAAAGRAQEDSDDDDDDDDDDEDDDSEEDEEWGLAAGARRGGRVPPQAQQPSPSVPVAGRERSKRKLQPPQHIPPQQVPVHQPPMPLRQPTPPPSPPPELSFPLPDTPKQSPPDMDEPEGAGPGAAAHPPPGLRRLDSDSSSGSSSPDPPRLRRPGPLSLLARKMESEGAFGADGRKRSEAVAAMAAKDGQADPAEAGQGEGSRPRAGRREEGGGGGAGPGVVIFPGGAVGHAGSSVVPVLEAPAPVDMSGSQPCPAAVPVTAPAPTSEPQSQAVTEEEKEKEKGREKEMESRLPPWKRSRDLASPTSVAAPAQAEEPPADQGESAVPPQHVKKSLFLRDMPMPLSSPPDASTISPPPALRKPRMFSDTATGSMVSPTKPVRQAVFVSGPPDIAMEVASPGKASAEKPEGDDVEMKQAEEETPEMETKKKGPLEFKDAEVKPMEPGLEPMGPVLPPAFVASREAEGKVERERQEKKRQEKKKGRRKTLSGSSDSSSSDSDSGSSSSHSSVSASSRDKARRKKAGSRKQEDDKQRQDKGEEKDLPAREVKSQPSGPPIMEVDPDPQSSPAQPGPEPDPDHSESGLEERSTPKAFAARKISLTTGTKAPPEGGAGEAESGAAAGRKRRWGSSTAVTAKKPSISITTDSLKSLIPDIKTNQEAVVELHPEELHLSGDEEQEEEDPPSRDSREDQSLDKGLKIRRTVTQVVPGEGQENGQREEEEEEEEEEKKVDRERGRSRKDRRKSSSTSEDAVKTDPNSAHDTEAKKVTPSDTLVRRSISQQKSGVSITIDDPVRTARQPSPPRGKVSRIVHVTNLVRPFTLVQLKLLLGRTGALLEEGFWIDKIKSHCYVTYATTEEAVATRAALHGVKWPLSNPKVLSVDFCEQDELDFHRGLLTAKRGAEPQDQSGPHGGAGPSPQGRSGPSLPPLMAERGALPPLPPPGGVRDQWAEREREMERRERTRAEREWDRHKIRDFGRPGEEPGARRSHSRERRRRERGERGERAKSRERRTDRKEKADEPPAKLLDDLFHKTKAAPCIYWLPLTEEQAAQRVRERAERQKEREKRRKEADEVEDKKREEERKERIKSREKEGSGVAVAAPGGGGGGAGWGGASGGRGDGDRERGRDRDREGGDKRREGGQRPRGPSSGGPSIGRRSRSRSNARSDRRR